MKKKMPAIASSLIVFTWLSCGNSEVPKTASKNDTGKKEEVASQKTEATIITPATDDAAIATIETSGFILKIHKAIRFSLKPKSYEPFKVDPSTKLIALDVSVRSKLSTPLNLSRILGMTVIKGKNEKNLLAPWVVAAHEVDYPEPNHQKEYDALWSDSFEPNGFHRAILFGINPLKDEKQFTIVVPAKADFNDPQKTSAQFSVE